MTERGGKSERNGPGRRGYVKIIAQANERLTGYMEGRYKEVIKKGVKRII